MSLCSLLNIEREDGEYSINIRLFDAYKERNLKLGNLFVDIGIPGLNEAADDGFLGIFQGLTELATASIALARLGDPMYGDVNVKVDGDVNRETIPYLEHILGYFSRSRTLVTGRDLREYKVNIIGNEVDTFFDPELDSGKVELALSGGMDSLACKIFLEESGYDVNPVIINNDPNNVLQGKDPVSLLGDLQKDIISAGRVSKGKGFHVKADISTLNKIPWNTRVYPDGYEGVWNFDDWGFYGRNALSAALLLYMGILNGSRYSAIGHTRGSLHVKVSDGETELFQDCCQSIEFVRTWNGILKALFPNETPYHVVPLAKVSKCKIARYLLNYPDELKHSHSCVEGDKIECGKCFSCAQKMTGILAGAEPGLLDLRYRKDRWEIHYGGKNISQFKWMPQEGDFGFWEQQLSRFEKEFPAPSRELRNSCFNPSMFLAVYRNLDESGKIDVPDAFHRIRDVAERKIESYYQRYCGEGEFISPIDFVEDFSL